MKTIYQSIRDAEKAAEEWRKANGKEPEKEKPVVYGAWNTPRI